jgi:hypothetical protein
MLQVQFRWTLILQFYSSWKSTGCSVQSILFLHFMYILITFKIRQLNTEGADHGTMLQDFLKLNLCFGVFHSGKHLHPRR